MMRFVELFDPALRLRDAGHHPWYDDPEDRAGRIREFFACPVPQVRRGVERELP
ncbi:MAG: hypothetical protein KY469_20470 [Actinobacteria bacterium]|nr:hypothetical protein [Actinomycetota bacterium]